MVARALAAFALAAGLLGASAPRVIPSPRLAAHPRPAATESPQKVALVLEQYAAALDELPAPRYISFEYSVEQSGGTNISELHRIYRAGRDQRDELIAEDGQRLRLPSVRIRHDAVDRYALAALAPTPARYTFTFAGSVKSGDHLAYTFRTEPKGAAGFVVEGVTLDGKSFLPAALRFRSSAGGIHGHGTLSFAKAERFWLIREARIDAQSKGAPVVERIVWSAYRFPSSLPSATFADQTAAPSAGPSAPP
jgi:hypothetical protein